MTKLIAGVAAVTLLAACGSGGGGDLLGSAGSSSGGSGGGTASMALTKAEVTPTTPSAGQTVAVHWTVQYSTPSVDYTTEFHVNDEPALIQGMPGLTRVFSANGDLGPSTLGKDATVNCTFGLSSGRPALLCGTYGSRYLDTFDLTKPLYGIFRACTYDGSMNQVCDTKSTGPLAFNQTAKEVSPLLEDPAVAPQPPAKQATGVN